MKKKVLLLAALMSLSFAVRAQESDSTSDEKARLEPYMWGEVQSQYLWRGKRLYGFCVAPELGLTYGGFSIDSWSAVDIVSPSLVEHDLTLAYDLGILQFDFVDYFCSPYGRNASYFGADSMFHVGEVGVSYQPADWLCISVNANIYGDSAHSAYFELAFPFKLKGMYLTPAIGCTTNGAYYDGLREGEFGVCNISLLAEKVVCGIPVVVTLQYNPLCDRFLVSGGLSLELLQRKD